MVNPDDYVKAWQREQAWRDKRRRRVPMGQDELLRICTALERSGAKKGAELYLMGDKSKTKSLRATINKDGDIVCPHCGTNVITPTETNPNNGIREKMIVIPFRDGWCPSCKEPYYCDAREAYLHNSIHFPEDYPKSKDMGPGAWEI